MTAPGNGAPGSNTGTTMTWGASTKDLQKTTCNPQAVQNFLMNAALPIKLTLSTEFKMFPAPTGAFCRNQEWGLYSDWCVSDNSVH